MKQRLPGIHIALLVACISLYADESQAAEVQSDCLERLRTAGIAAWIRHEEAADGVQFTGRFTDTLKYEDSDHKPQTLSRDYSFRVKRIVQNRCLLVEEDRPNGQMVVKGLNHEYRFELERQSKDRALLLSKIGTPSKSPVLSSSDYFWDRYAWEIEGGIALSDIVTRPDAFRIDIARVEDDGGNETVYLQATNLEHADKRGKYGVPGAVYSVSLNPESSWAITQFSVRYSPKGTQPSSVVSGEITYSERREMPPFVRRIHKTMVIGAGRSDGTPNQETIVELELPEPLTDIREFFITHYGIDDEAVRGDSRGGLTRLLWFLLGVIALAATWWLLKRRAQAGA